MTDNELFNHFKAQSISFDEVPSNDLWARIESGLDNGKPTVKPYTLLFIVTAIAITCALAYYLLVPNKSETISPVALPATKSVIIPVSEPLPLPVATQPDTPLTAKKIVETPIITITSTKEITPVTTPDSVKKPRIRTAKFFVVNTVQPISFRKINKTAIPEPTTYEVKKQETVGNIIITTKQKITADEYQKLIEDMLKANETSFGTLLTIKAPGHKPFRKVIGMETVNGVVKMVNIDSVLNKSVKIEPLNTPLQLEKPQLNITTINPAYIEYGRPKTNTTDSLSNKK